MGQTHDPWEARIVYTVGHSNRTPDELMQVLTPAGIHTLVDVRRYPSSRRHPHFNRSEIRGFLLRQGIIYHHLGQQLGGMLDGSYQAYMQEETFRKGLVMLEDLADSSATAIMCAEREPRDCHRSHISDALMDRGWNVVHLLGPDDRQEHRTVAPQRQLF